MSPVSLKPLAKDTSGVTAVEFALIMVPLLVLVLGGLELAYQSSLRVLAQGALGDSARKATVQNPVFSGPGTTEQRLVAAVQDSVRNLAPKATVVINQRSYSEFTGVGQPEKIVDDKQNNGVYDKAHGDCFLDANGNGVYDQDMGKAGRGGSNDVVYYIATVTAPNLIPVPAFVPSGDGINITVSTAVRNQPFGNQPAPERLCGK